MNKLENTIPLARLQEKDIILNTFIRFFDGQKNTGFICKYIPQFTTTDSASIDIEYNSNVLTTQQEAVAQKKINEITLEPGKAVEDNSILRFDDLKIIGLPFKYIDDTIIGYFIFFSRKILEKDRLYDFIKYCEENISLRKRADAMYSMQQAIIKLPDIDSEDFYSFLGKEIADATKCAEVIVLKRHKIDPRKFTTVFSLKGNCIEIPDIPVSSALNHCIKEKRVVVNNNVDIKNDKYTIHNQSFLKKNNYNSFIGRALLNDFSEHIFVIFCLFKRQHAISNIEQDILETICTAIDGICSRVLFKKEEKPNHMNEYYKILKHYLLIADVMHDSSEDLMIARENISSINAKGDDVAKVDSAKRLLDEIITSSRAFKLNFNEQKSNIIFSSIETRNLKEIVAEVINKFTINGINKNIDFYNLVPPNIESKFIVCSLRRAISNAIKNSIHHLKNVSYRRREIRISARRSADSIILEIFDNGLGIDPKIKQHVTELGFSTTNGMGHGLSIIEAAAIEHKGLLEIDSKPNAYCKIILILPIHY